MNYFDWSGLFAAVGVLAFLQLALAIVGIIGSLISLVHSLNEETKRTSFIVFSSLGLGIGVLGFWNLIFAILGFVFMMISLSQDTKFRNYMAYILIVILITGIGGTGYAMLSDKLLDKLEESNNDLANVGVDTLNQLGAGISNQNTEVTYQDTNTNTMRDDLNREGVAVLHSGGTYTTYNKNSNVVVNVTLSMNDDGTIIAKDMYTNTYIITKVVNEDGDTIHVGNAVDDTSTDDQTDSGYYWITGEENTNVYGE